MKPGPTVHPNAKDPTGKNSAQRFEEIERHFLDLLRASGVSRAYLYSRPKPGDAREPTEEEVVRRWAEQLHVSVNDICIGIQRAFMKAAERGDVLTSFRYCVPHIVARYNELRDARVGANFQSGQHQPTNVRPNPKALERIRAREEARRVLGAGPAGVSGAEE